ncbi:M4 family metallopeptidase [Flavobacterium okayamense]|uniref:Por secretion system C-terminal sorting domain-containing protein n=1 Tax=Flavobacterium okayamense TaxID=2830782 RepID=A0ABM7S2V8_9FLAO|nr:M4 family metallopeptidase [Flavobacterium okayamense]BCY27933.1 hypothetical protein KK2020170_08010 [Flavobacterium okayamense]
MKKIFFALSFLVFSLSVTSQNREEKSLTNQKFLRINEEISPEKALKVFSMEFKLNKEVSFSKVSSNVDKVGFIHEKYQQFYKGLKVEFGTAIVHSKDGKARLVNGELYAIENQNIQPNLNSEQGLAKAIQYINAESYLWENEVQSKIMDYVKPDGELLLLPNLNSGSLILAYKYDIYATQPISRNEVYIDANSGEILLVNAIIKHAHELFSNEDLKFKKEQVERAVLATGNADTRYSGSRQIETTFDGTNYILQDYSRGNGILTYNCEDTGTYQDVDFIDNDNNWTSAEHANVFKDDGALDAHWGAEITYDFWGNIFGRNSFDNNGAAIRSYVHHGNYNNASWNGSVMTYGDGTAGGFDILTSIDVCGHEIGHAVCTYTANLVYANESGAMNEAFSDIWGACIEHYGRTGSLTTPRPASVWLIGEDLGNALRSMSNPNSKGDPDTYGGTFWYTGTADNGGVHTNSGVLNHWFYILSEGESGTNNAPSPDTYNVTGIGLDKAAEIAYLAERDYLTPNSTYLDARNATIEVVYNLYCANSPEAESVTNAWYAVNVGESYVAVNYDVALQSIAQNQTIPCTTNSFATTISFKNQGLNSLSSVNISYNVDGGANTNEVWNGTLGLCQETTYPISVTGLSRGAHTLNITTTVTSDARPENNTKSIVFFINDSGIVNVVNPFSTISDELIAYNDEGTSTWFRGVRGFGAMSSAGNTVYLINDTGDYPDATKSYLVSQCYDLTTLSSPQLSFDMKFDLEEDWDIVYVEYSTDFGANWNVLGTMGANWYNSNRTLASSGGNDCYNCPGAQWTGTNTTNTNYFYSLSALNSETNIIFRIVFHSDEAVTQLGVNVDNFLISGTLSNESFNTNEILVYPNPSKGIYNISLGTNQLEKIEVYDINGRLILNQNSFENSFETKIDLSNASTGVYFIKISAEGKNFVKRIVKE